MLSTVMELQISGAESVSRAFETCFMMQEREKVANFRSQFSE